MAAALIELQARQVAHEQAAITPLIIRHLQVEALLITGKAGDFQDPQRVALLGHEQAPALAVVGQALEALVAIQAQPQGQLLAVGGIQPAGVVVHVHLEQTLGALVADHIDTRTDVLHRLGIAKAGQGHAPQDFPGQGQLDQFGALVGHGKQAAPVGVVGQRRNVITEAVDHLGLDRHPIVRQPQRAALPLGRMAPFLH